jgi:hypothetical protein
MSVCVHVRTSQITHCALNIKADHLMLYSDVIPVCFNGRTERVNA